MEVIIIAAVAENRVIGKDNDLIWHLPKDLKFFKDTTSGYPVIMGRRNYFSIPEKYRPLPNRLNIVLTRKRDLNIEDVKIFHELQDSIDWLRNEGHDKIFIIGGGQVYANSLKENVCNKMYITHVHETFEGDTFFPEWNNDQWEVSTLMEHQADDKNPHDFTIKEYRLRA